MVLGIWGGLTIPKNCMFKAIWTIPKKIACLKWFDLRKFELEEYFKNYGSTSNIVIGGQNLNGCLYF